MKIITSKRKSVIFTLCGAVFAVITALLSSAVVLEVPVSVMILNGIISVGFFTAAAVYTEKKVFSVVRICLVTIVLAAAILFGFICNPYAGSFMIKSSVVPLNAGTVISAADAESDIKEAWSHLKKVHPLFINSIPEEAENAYSKALDRISPDGISFSELQRRIESIVSPLHDAHTSVHAEYSNERVPFDYAEKVKGQGLNLTEVNGQPLGLFVEEHKELFSYERESWAVEKLYSYLLSNNGLDYLGLSTDVTFTYENENERIEQTYTDADFIPVDEYMEKNAQYYNTNEKFVHYELCPEKNYALLTLKSCNYNDEYKDTLQKMFSEIEEKNIGNVIVDLRKNGGGSDQVAWEFISYLPVDSFSTVSYEQRLGFFTKKSGDALWKTKKCTPVFSGQVYILTSADSFSSAMLFPLYIKDNSLGKVIGEIPGNSVNGYGEIASFRLDKSGLKLTVSTKKFSRADKNAGDYVIPDIETDSRDALETAVSLCF